MTDEDLIADEDVVVTISGRGYIKRQPVDTYRRQHRGGKGIIGHVTREEDAVEHLLVANTHDWALFFTNRGRVFSAKVHAIPDASRQAKGMAIINLPGVQVESGEVPMATIMLKDFKPGTFLVLATRKGIIKKTPLEQFERVRSTGIRAITIARRRRARLGRRLDRRRRRHHRHGPGHARPVRGERGPGRWAATRPASSASASLAQGDAVVGMSVVEPDSRPARPDRDRLRQARADRASSGASIAAARASGSSRSRAARPASSPPSSRSPRPTRSSLLISAGGQVIRTETNTINRYSSSARGVIVMRLAEGDRVAAIAAFRAGLAERDGMGDDGAPDGRPGQADPSGAVTMTGFGEREAATLYADQFEIYHGNANPELARKIAAISARSRARPRSSSSPTRTSSSRSSTTSARRTSSSSSRPRTRSTSRSWSC